ncbi:MAG TPA: aldose 1-epimerase [Solirubrobacteraceae bacterium]|nr:aldose 1-epimerase [Solirubrobacteraceae bacterium]
MLRVAVPHAVEGLEALVVRSPGGALEAAFVPAAGMVGASLRHRGDELLGQRRGVAAYAASGDTMGIPLLHPWANRLSRDGYEAAGRSVALPAAAPYLPRDERGRPIHGIHGAGPWTVRDAGRSHLRAELRFADRPELLAAFPYPHRVVLDVRLDDAELRVRTTIVPLADRPVPVAFGFHPYLCLPGEPRARWRLRLPAMRRLELDGRGIPTGRTLPFGPWRAALGRHTFDDCFEGVPRGAALAVEGGGRRVAVRWCSGFPVAQVYAPADDDVVALEPMTAPVDALVSGRGLRTVPRGGAYEASFAITVEDR